MTETTAWRGDSERNRFVNNREPLVSVAPEKSAGRPVKSWLVVDERESPPGLYRYFTFQKSLEMADSIIETHGEGPGHPFRGNQYTAGSSVSFNGKSGALSVASWKDKAKKDELVQVRVPPGSVGKVVRSDPDGHNVIVDFGHYESARVPRHALDPSPSSDPTALRHEPGETKSMVGEHADAMVAKFNSHGPRSFHNQAKANDHFGSDKKYEEAARAGKMLPPDGSTDAKTVQQWGRWARQRRHDLGIATGADRAILASMKKRAARRSEKHGEGPGHPFRGNQYTDGIGGGGESGGNGKPSAEETKSMAGGSADAMVKKFNSGGKSEGRLSPAQEKLYAEAKAKFEEDFAKDPAAMVERYWKLKDAKDGDAWVINPDIANSLSSHYADQPENRAMLSSAVNETAIKVAQAAYAHALAQPVAPGHIASVLVTAGGSGAGKSYGIENIDSVKSIKHKAHVVIDGMGGGGAQLMGPELVEKQIATAKKNGFTVGIVNVDRDPVDAYLNGVVPRGIVEKRMTTAAEAIQGHITNSESIAHLREKYKDDPDVQFSFVKNEIGGAARVDAPRDPKSYDKKAMLAQVEKTLKTPKLLSKTYKASIERLKSKMDKDTYERALKGIIPDQILAAALTGL